MRAMLVLETTEVEVWAAVLGAFALFKKTNQTVLIEAHLVASHFPPNFTLEQITQQMAHAAYANLNQQLTASKKQNKTKKQQKNPSQVWPLMNF